MDTRFKNTDWNLANPEGRIATWQHVQIAVLMDIRDELKKLNDLLHCSNFTDIPNILRRVSTNTAKQRAKRVVK